jgi:hypothetical protein
MLCFDLMEMVGKQVVEIRTLKNHKDKSQAFLNNIKNHNGNFKCINIKLLKNWN